MKGMSINNSLQESYTPEFLLNVAIKKAKLALAVRRYFVVFIDLIAEIVPVSYDYISCWKKKHYQTYQNSSNYVQQSLPNLSSRYFERIWVSEADKKLDQQRIANVGEVEKSHTSDKSTVCQKASHDEEFAKTDLGHGDFGDINPFLNQKLRAQSHEQVQALGVEDNVIESRSGESKEKPDSFCTVQTVASQKSQFEDEVLVGEVHQNVEDGPGEGDL